MNSTFPIFKVKIISRVTGVVGTGNNSKRYVLNGRYRPNRLRFVLPISTHVIIPLGSLSIVLLLHTWDNFAWRETCRRNQKIFCQEIDHMT